MTTYAESGVDIAAGDSASKKAYTAAMRTFTARQGMMGAPVTLEGGFAGALDFGKYYLILGCDGVGTKIDIALETGIFHGLGYDLLAMVSDDAICVGAETVAITNTFDTKSVNPEQIGAMMESLAEACIVQKITIPGGEIAELGSTLQSTIWNATALGIVEKEKYLTGERIAVGDTVIALQEKGFRSNGFSLVRKICQTQNISYQDEYMSGRTWGEALLEPSIIYHNAVLTLIGRFGEKAQIDVHGIAHITGGGIAGNFFRILKKKNLGAKLPDIWDPAEMVLELQKRGEVADREAYRTWNMGNGMLMVVSPQDAEKTVQLLSEQGIRARSAGTIIAEPRIVHKNCGAFATGEMLEFHPE